MKRDLTSSSKAYLPPRMSVVEVCAEHSLNLTSREVNIKSHVDEIQTMDDENEKYWVEF